MADADTQAQQPGLEHGPAPHLTAVPRRAPGRPRCPSACDRAARSTSKTMRRAASSGCRCAKVSRPGAEDHVLADARRDSFRDQILDPTRAPHDGRTERRDEIADAYRAGGASLPPARTSSNPISSRSTCGGASTWTWSARHSATRTAVSSGAMACRSFMMNLAWFYFEGNTSGEKLESHFSDCSKMRGTFHSGMSTLCDLKENPRIPGGGPARGGVSLEQRNCVDTDQDRCRTERSRPRSPRRCCSAPMPSVFSRWPRRATIPSSYWIDPEARGIIPLDSFHVSHSLRKTIRNGPFTVDLRHAVRRGDRGLRRTGARPGARPGSTRRSSISAASSSAWAMPTASRTWLDGKLVGGLYGISLGGAFFGESMFSTATRCQQDRPGASGGAPAPGQLRPAGHPVRYQASLRLRRPGDPARGLSQAPDRRLARQAHFATELDPETLEALIGK